MNRSMTWTAALFVGFAVSLSIGASKAQAGTVNGVAVKLDGQPNAGVIVTTGVDTKVSDAKGAFTVTTPNVRPFTLTLTKGDLVVRVENLDGFSTHTLTVIVPDPTGRPCYEVRPRCRFCRRR